jgi:hypothetical protein
VVIALPTRRPTATPIIPTAAPSAVTPTPILPTPTFPPRRYKVSFEAEETTLTLGECTNLKWEVEGGIAVTLDDKAVEPSGKKEVCPDNDSTYRLTVQFPDRARLERKNVDIKVIK